MASWSDATTALLTSICCVTYNHEQFIEDALYGFLMQVTDFPVEIIVHDDASTDNTPSIIRQYEQQYPRLIKTIYQSENQYSRGLSPSTLIRNLSRGKYIAVCEGDDCWTDPNKLQIQLDYLEQNPNVVISGHDALVVDEQNEILSQSKLHNRHKRDCSGEELILNKTLILTLSWMYRNVGLEDVPEKRMVKNGDRFFLSLIGHYGGSHYHHDIKPALYHVHNGGIWSKLSSEAKKESHINTWFWLYSYYKRIDRQNYARHYWMKFLQEVFCLADANDLSNLYFDTIKLPKRMKSFLLKTISLFSNR